MRLLEIGERSKRQVELMSDETRAQLEAYSRGINEFVKRSWLSPIEYYVLGVSFDEWEPWHCIALARMMQFFVSKGGNSEINKDVLRVTVGDELAEIMDP